MSYDIPVNHRWELPMSAPLRKSARSVLRHSAPAPRPPVTELVDEFSARRLAFAHATVVSMRTWRVEEARRVPDWDRYLAAQHAVDAALP
jgi:hypothetical protein